MVAPRRAAPDDQAGRRSAPETASRKPAIELHGVSKRYGDNLVLEPTDLAVRDGEFFCLLGPSGCGKTTLLNLIGGFVAPTSGEVHIRGECVNELPPNKRNANTVFQSYALFPHMTVEQNVGFGLKMSGVAKPEATERISEALQRVGLEAWGKRIPGQLSGGQQQRVAVARALVNRPAVLLLDEPLGALDLKFRRRLQFELAELHRDVGMTFVYVTHDQEEAMAMADRIAVLNHGRIDQVGTPEEIYRRPRSRFVADFIGDSNFISVRVDDAGLGRVSLPDGHELPAAVVPRGCTGMATLMVRPEAIEVTQGRQRTAGLSGQIAQAVFLGSHTRIVITCERVADPIVVALHGAHQAPEHTQLGVGKQVHLKWERESAVVLTDDGARRGDEHVDGAD